jgi:hypothetical protein
LAKYIKEKEKVLDDWSDNAVYNIVKEVVKNDETPDGHSLYNAVAMMRADMSKWNLLYSMGRAHDIVVAAAGTIIREAQLSRNKRFTEIKKEIARVTHALYAAGEKSTRFMYEDEGHIISDIDWNLYDEARNNFIKSLYKRGLKYDDFDFRDELETWEWDNTEDRAVDVRNGVVVRTERVPNQNYRKEFPKLTDAQQKYYDAIMQIKGEIGTLLPEYARMHYFPPQKRRNMVDALGDAARDKSIKKAGKAVWNKVSNLWKIREDDTNYAKNGIIDGVKYKMVRSDYDNAPLTQIPIFNINRVEQGELMKDFSGTLQSLAGTALNYDEMSKIQQVVEYMADFVKSKSIKEKKAEGDMVQGEGIRLWKAIKKKATSNNTSEMMDAWIAQHIYGQKREQDPKWWQILMDKTVNYTSVKNLATNIFGMVSNTLVGEWQMMIESGAGEFYGKRDFLLAHLNLFGRRGMIGDVMELMSNNVRHKSTLLAQRFDPSADNFIEGTQQRYHKSFFRKLIGRDLTFIGYGIGEHFLHYINMYAVLNHEKVQLNGKTISLYNAFEVGDTVDGNAELKLKQGVTMLDGSAVTEEYLDMIRDKIKYCNDTCHGAMNEEDKGLIHQKCIGRAAANFRQWMVEHYSRRLSGSHFDYTLREYREGYWYSICTYFKNNNQKDNWRRHRYWAMPYQFMKDALAFMFRVQTHWDELSETQKYNLKRANSEIWLFFVLAGFSFALGGPEDHKQEYWRRFWIYQVKRLMLDEEASMPHPKAVNSAITIMQSPMANIQTINAWFYLLTGWTSDYGVEIKSGPHKGEDKYWKNVKKYAFPWFKDYWRMKDFGSDESLFKVFENTPDNR